MEFILLVLVVGVVLHRIDKRLKGQAREIDALRQALARLTAGQGTAGQAGAGQAPVAELAASPLDQPPIDQPATVDTPQPASVLADTGADDAPSRPESDTAPPAPARSRWRDLEESLASRWLIWLGGVTMALAAAFFIKLSVEHGWLGPGIRVTLGLLAGFGLMIGGEWLRRQPDQRMIAAIKPDYVPPALTAAGLFAAFASVYGAYALFGLFPPLIAFVLLAALSLAGIGLSLLQGPFIAALGLLAGFVTPMLVSSDNPMAWGLFVYLLALNGAGLTVVLWRGWGWLGWSTLVAATLWPLLWLGEPFHRSDALPLGLYLLITSVMFLMPAVLGRGGMVDPEEAPPATDRHRSLPAWVWPWFSTQRRRPLDRLALVAMGALGVAVVGLVWRYDHGGVPVAALGLFALLALVIGRRVERLAGIAWTAALVVLAALAAWHLPWLAGPPPVRSAEGQPLVTALLAALPEETVRFLWTTGGFAALFGVGGFVALWEARRVALWASLSAVIPTVLLAMAYAVIAPPLTDVAWPTAALLLAALLVGATTPLARHRHRPGATLGLAAFAAGAVGALSLGATMSLREAWLTVALALQVPVLAWLERQLNVRELRGITLLVAVAVLVRLALNPHILDYEGMAWIAYGYGLPALGFLAAAHWLRDTPDGRGDDLVVMVLEAGGLIFTTMMISLGIHRWMAGSLAAAPSTLAEASLHTLAWLGLALLLAADRRWNARPVAVWGRRLLVAVAAVQVVVVQMLGLNPLWTDESVGNWPVVNRLLLAYGAPGLLGLLYLWLDRLPPRRLRSLLPLLPFALFALNLALEIRRAFQGPVLSGYETSDAEWYSYSAGFLLFGVLLLLVALRFGWGWMRHAGLVLLLAVVAKVFLSDMDDLEGMYRVASFLGLGVSLIGVGYLYQRVSLPSGRPSAGPQPDDPLDQRTH